MSSDEQLDLEFAYTSNDDSCRDLYSPLQYCRRPAGHGGAHATGFGGHRVAWGPYERSDVADVVGPPA